MVTEFVLLDGLSLQVKLKKGEKSRKLQVDVLFVCFSGRWLSRLSLDTFQKVVCVIDRGM